INIVNISTLAVIPVGAIVNAGTGDIAVTAASDSSGSTTARPAEAPADNTTSGNGSVGVGASVAVALIDDVTTAGIDGTLTGGDDVSITATTQDLMLTDAKTGAKGNVAVAPAVGITL